MTNEEINLQKLNYNLNKSVQFRVSLNKMYSDLSFKMARRKGKHVRQDLYDIIKYIYENIELIVSLPREDRYIVLNCVKLGRSIGYKLAIQASLEEEYQKLDEIYRNSR